MKPQLTVEALPAEAATFAETESAHDESSLYCLTDGKAVSTYLEHKFQSLLNARYTYDEGSSVQGIDFSGLKVDLKVASIKLPVNNSAYR